jgi:isoquinoline 1-oxidoreductase
MSADVANRPTPDKGQSGSSPRPAANEDVPEIGAWLHFGDDGTITVYCGKAEVGQSVRASLAQAVAEELRVPMARVQMVLGDTGRTPFDLGTYGSRTTPILAPRLRKVAASARALFVDRAAARWGVAAAALTVADGQVRHPPTGRAAGYSDLAGSQPLAEHWREDAAVTAPAAWTVAGRSVPKVAGAALVTGAHRYTPDLRRPGMLAGAILRPPAFGATLTTLDTRAAADLPGVTVVQEGEFVGITAPDRPAALRARAALQAAWDVPPPPVAQADLFAYFKTHPAPSDDGRQLGGPTIYEEGALAAGWAAADHTLEAAYTIAYIAHAPLEPRAAVAEWAGDHLTVWTGTQRPFGVRAELARAFGLAEEQVRVVVPDTGGAYGGKHTGEVALEAARLARAVSRPVQVVWTREEEFTWAYFRPAGLIEVRSAFRADGIITAWDYHNYNSGAAALRPPYAIAHQRVAFHPTAAPLRQGSYRALAATANHFARESHVDEIAARVGLDPVTLRLKNLRDPRLRTVLEAAATRFGWGTARPAPGHGCGIAAGTEKGSYIATCAEVAVDRVSGQARLVRVVAAFECGAIVNPDGLQNQVEGALVQALGGALFEQINFAGGRILTDRFSRYRVPRFGDVPPIEIVLLDRRDLPPAGAGETPIVGLAPAVGNAIYAATGHRLRALPLVPQDNLPPAAK